MHNTYINPPVTEALCEFEFVPDQPLDITVVGLFYEKIRSEFPKRQQQMAIASLPEKGAFGLTMHLRVQFSRSDGSAVVSASPEVLTVSLLKPYTKWQDFKSLVLSNFEIFKEIISPKCLKRIGLRYINRFDFSESPTERLEDNFNFHPTVPQDLPQHYAVFADRVEIPYEEGRNRFGIALHTMSEKPDVLSFILDLAYYTATPESAESVALDGIGQWIETAHDRIEDAFEKCITERCRTRFGGTK
jgi:uncharacterized protein (TIGR04255 family)